MLRLVSVQLPRLPGHVATNLVAHFKTEQESHGCKEQLLYSMSTLPSGVLQLHSATQILTIDPSNFANTSVAQRVIKLASSSSLAARKRDEEAMLFLGAAFDAVQCPELPCNVVRAERDHAA